MNLKSYPIPLPAGARQSWPRSAVGGSQPKPGAVERLTWQEIMAVSVFGLAMALPMSREHPIFLGELISFAVFAWFFISVRLGNVTKRLHLRWLLVAMPIMFLGYVLSDLIGSPDSYQMMKTWVRVVFQFADLIAVACLIGTRPRRCDWIIFAYAVGSIAFGSLNYGGFSWKSNGAVPLDLVAAFIAKRCSRPVGAGVLIGVGILNLVLDCRSPAAAAILAGVIYFVGSSYKYVKNFGIFQILTIVVVAMITLNLAWKLASPKSLERQSVSTRGRATEFMVILGECLRSPIVGHGSAYVSSDILDQVTQRNLDESPWGRRGDKPVTMAMSGHSEIIQTWFEGGILGAALIALMLYWDVLAVKGVLSAKLLRDTDPLLLVAILINGWNLLASPFAGTHRVDNAIFFGATMVTRVYLKQVAERERLEKAGRWAAAYQKYSPLRRFRT